MKTVITQKQRGLKFKNGSFRGLLLPGKYTAFGSTTIEMVELGQPINTKSCTVNQLLEDRDMAEATVSLDVADGQLAFHFVDGKLDSVHKTGRYAFWKAFGEHSFKIVDITKPDVPEDIPQHILGRIASLYCRRFEIEPYEKGRLYFDQKLVRILEPGIHYFWKNDIQVNVSLVDTRLLQMDIAGQEMLTQDKVTLRINFVCHYRITDYVRIVTEIDDYEEQLHVAAQLALRDYVGKHKLDELLENKEAMSRMVFERLKEREASLFLTVCSADVKDIILPGEIRDIMNMVLVAEKKAQANVITRREEVASTRSLLNTAKLMEENPTLYKLKELEYVERICENVGSIHLSGSGDLLSQLAGILSGKA